MRHFILLALALFSLSPAFAEKEGDSWKTFKSTHFLVYYQGASPEFIEELAQRSEEYYDRIADALGFRRFDFWLWDNRAQIYVYDNKRAYQEATGQPGWSGGCSLIGSREKTILCFPYEEGFFQTVLPHEMGHIIFKEFVGFSNPAVPYWLDEGVASFQESFRAQGAKKLVQKAISGKKFMDLERLFSFDPYASADGESVGIFYSEAVSLVDFLIQEFSKEDFVVFCQNLRDKKDFQRALSSAYPFSSIRELDQAWQKYLKDE